MIFAGVDPGTDTWAFASVNEIGNLIDYFEIPAVLVEKDYVSLFNRLLRNKPKLIALPSGHGMPFLTCREIGNREIFFMTLKDPFETGPLRNFLIYARSFCNVITIPGVKELLSISESKKRNLIDMGTADKVASAFFYITRFPGFVLVEMGRHFSAIIVVVDRKIVNGVGGSVLPGLRSNGAIDGEIAYLLSKYSKISKESIYEGGNLERSIEVIESIASYYSRKHNVPIIISGPAKDVFPYGIKFQLPYKEAAVGAALIANAFGGGYYRKYMESVISAGNPLSYIDIKGWEKIVSLIETL
ncbi:acetate kinase [Sulfolobales archaeon HS-7]|nr:acetate kinase [Sulfolobales archaeon HS-7]